MKTTPYLSLTQAEKLVEASKPTILKSIKDGSLPIRGKTEKGGYEIDPTDLFAKFDPKNNQKVTTPEKPEENRILPPATDTETALLEKEIEHLKEKLKWQQKEIQEKKELLEQQREQTQKWQEMAQSNQRLLTYQQTNIEKPPEKPVETPKKFLGMFPYKNA
jgi:FtsZ-binding cell division protein ZapB